MKFPWMENSTCLVKVSVLSWQSVHRVAVISMPCFNFLVLTVIHHMWCMISVCLFLHLQVFQLEVL